jgi:hypothetical protein
MAKYQISEWFDCGLRAHMRYMAVYRDTFDYTCYPLYYTDAQDYYAKSGEGPDRLMEVYDLHMDKDLQLNEHRANHAPKLRRSQRLKMKSHS